VRAAGIVKGTDYNLRPKKIDELNHGDRAPGGYFDEQPRASGLEGEISGLLVERYGGSNPYIEN